MNVERPDTLEAAAEAVSALRAAGRTAIVVGGATSLETADPGPQPDVHLDTRGLDAIESYEPADLTVTCGAGVTLARLEETLAAAGQTLPVWHPAPDRATIGGLCAFGWTGLGRTFGGRLRDRVLEVHAVTGEGKLVRGGARVVKNVTGFDLPRLFFGSLGTLGVIVQLTLKTHPRPSPLHARVTSHPEPRPLALMLRQWLDRVRMPAEAIIELTEESEWRGWAFAPGPSADAEAMLGLFREGSDLGDGDAVFSRLGTDPVLSPGAGGPDVVYRVSVPPSDAPALLARLPGPRRVVADVGAGVVWAGADDTTGVSVLRELAEERGGALVLLRAPPEARRELGTWGRPPAGIEIMRRLKAQFDPDGVLAPGRFVV